MRAASGSSNNDFGTVFNHAISLKSGVAYELIENNRFAACGRTCINLGQQPTGTCKQAVVNRNTFRGLASDKSLVGVEIANILQATITNNSFDDDRGAIKIERGPSGRRIVQSGNRF